MGRGLDGYFYFAIPEVADCAVFRCCPSGRSLTICGGDCERETPLPIPNRAVKPLSADGTWPARARESRTPPLYFDEPSRQGRLVLVVAGCGRNGETHAWGRGCAAPGRRALRAGRSGSRCGCPAVTPMGPCASRSSSQIGSSSRMKARAVSAARRRRSRHEGGALRRSEVEGNMCSARYDAPRTDVASRPFGARKPLGYADIAATVLAGACERRFVMRPLRRSSRARTRRRSCG
jgi:hypothetical protein